MESQLSTKVFAAKRIVTMDRSRPRATHVAVRDGRILGVGAVEDVASWGDYVVDETFADKVLLPGFVEGHSHMLAGGIWRFTYVGYQDRIAPDGSSWAGMRHITAVIERLREAADDLPSSEPVIAWGFDPIFLTTSRLRRHDLDKVSTDRPIAVIHSNFHLMTVNSRALELAEYDRNSGLDGIDLDENGDPTGELREMAAMFPVMRRLSIDLRTLGGAEAGIRAFGNVCHRCGVTTATDLMNDLPVGDVTLIERILSEEAFPARLVLVLNAHSATPEEIVQHALELRDMCTDKMRLGSVKIVTDGSIQGFTARIRWPGYYKGPDHGIWNIAPEQLMTAVDCFNSAGIQMHIHVNGDEASEVAIIALERALDSHPQGDHRHVLHHCQMADAAQYRLIKQLGLCVNLFANHIYYFGDKHYELTIGPDRAMRIDACGTALREGIPFAIHSDAPVTPMAPLFTAWCAVNRVTESGRLLGGDERIGVEDALRAITLGAAHTLHLDHEIGSIEAGKRADFTVLEGDPLAVAPEALKDVPIWGTVLGGATQPIMKRT